MLRLPILLVLLINPTRPARITDKQSLADILEKLYEKLEKITIIPPSTLPPAPTPSELELYEKFDKLNSLTPDKSELPDEAEELLSAMHMWAKLSPEQLDEVVKDLQKTPEDTDDEKSEHLNEMEYTDSEWNDEDLADGDYLNDKYWENDNDLNNGVTSKPNLGITPSALNRLDYRSSQTIISAVDLIAATNSRPRIIDYFAKPSPERSAQLKLAQVNIATMIKESKCRAPQPRWLSVWQLAPATSIEYFPSCVKLHRCTPDTGCCQDSKQMCAPIAGEYVTNTFFLHKADSSMNPARIQFFNHTQCGCVSRETLQTSTRKKKENNNNNNDNQESNRELAGERQNDWRAPTAAPKLDSNEQTSDVPQSRRCTCPTLFLPSVSESGSCSCVCEWPDNGQRRDCLSLARGREHFGLMDRACVIKGECTQPTCDYGAYDRSNGMCPFRRYRKSKYHSRARYQSEKIDVL